MYGRALAAQEILASLGFNSFVPMEMRASSAKSASPKLEPILSNLIFVDAPFEQITQLCKRLDYLYYLTDKTSLNGSPMVVDRQEMQQFIDFVKDRFDQVEYLDSKGLALKEGERVIITEGPFEGKEGTLIKVEGKARKQIVVAIEGLLAVSIKTPKPWSIVQRLPKVK